MDIADRVRLKSDRPGRVLVLALCVTPLAAPLLAAGLSVLLKEAPPSADAAAQPEVRSAPAPAPAPPEMMAAVFSPQPLAGAERPRLEKPAPAPAVKAPVTLRGRISGPRVLRNVSVVDGLRLSADGMVIALEGVGPVPAGSECKRLDGVVEPCAARAANRLDILTRGRPVVCELRESDAGDVRGLCRAGKIDLAEDLVRNGLALRTNL